MFDMFKPMLMATLGSAAKLMDARAEWHLQTALDHHNDTADYIIHSTVAHIWRDASRMICESLAK